MPRPIFILGLLQRSGTNYLRDLLAAHPSCAGTEVMAEDFLLHHAELLAQYRAWVQRHWASPLFPDDVQRLGDELFRTLGDALTEFAMGTVEGERPVLKTPSVRNLDLFFDLFGDAALLIIVRDGRSLVESGMRSFGWDFEQATRRWAQSVDTVLAFRQRMNGRPEPWRLVRYEDLVTDVRVELSAALVAVGLDPDSYDFSAAENLPVKGSSTYRGGRGEVHWDAVKRGEDFRPLDRWAEWSRARHERFNWLAGSRLRALGYTPREASDHTALWSAWNRWRDAKWLATRYGEKVKRAIPASITGRKV